MMSEPEPEAPSSWSPESSGIAEGFLRKIRKKGNPSWDRTNALGVKPEWKHPDLHYRWVEDDSDRIWNREQMGYVMANPESGGGLMGEFRSDAPGSTPKKREMVLMVNSRENVQRYQTEVDKRTDHTVLHTAQANSEAFAKMQRESGMTNGPGLKTRLVIE